MNMQDNGLFIKNLFIKHSSLNVAANIISIIGPVVSSVMAGKIFGGVGLAVTGLFLPLFFLAGFFGTAVSGGGSAVAAKYLAKDDLERVSCVYTLSMLMITAMGVILFLGLFLPRSLIISAVVKDASLMPYARGYYVYSLFYTFFTMLVYMPLSWARLDGRPFIGVVMTSVLTVLNIAGNFLLVYVVGMGVEGLALSQAAATAIAFVCAMLMLHNKKGSLRFVFSRNAFDDLPQIIMVGSPSGLSRLYRFVSVFMINAALMSAYGSTAVAINGVLNMLLRFITGFATGVSSAVMPMAGVFSEERDSTSTKQLMRTAFIYGNVLVAAAALFMFAMHDRIAALFGMYEPDTIYVFYHALAFFCAYIIFFFNGTVFVSYYTAVSRVIIANIVTFAQDMLFLTMLVYLFKDFVDASLIWMYLPVSGAATAIVMATALAEIKARNRDLSIPLLLDRKLEENGKYISFSVDSDPAAASEASAKISDFCEESGLPPKQTMLISMSIEEIVSLIVSNGSLNKRNPLAVRLFLLEGSIILRFRNGGRKFNPVAYYRNNISSDIEKCLDLIGLKYIVETAQVVYYREAFGVNNLVIII